MVEGEMRRGEVRFLGMRRKDFVKSGQKHDANHAMLDGLRGIGQGQGHGQARRRFARASRRSQQKAESRKQKQKQKQTKWRDVEIHRPLVATGPKGEEDDIQTVWFAGWWEVGGGMWDGQFRPHLFCWDPFHVPGCAVTKRVWCSRVWPSNARWREMACGPRRPSSPSVFSQAESELWCLWRRGTCK